jgi:DNA-directed RNA polymerase specialized sigma24 family protein
VHVLTQDAFRQEPSFTKFAFNRLLEWLDDGEDSRGVTYLEMHRRLVTYFDRRGRPSPNELADETLNRIGKTLERDGVIETTPPARYCYVIARFVLLEDIRRERRHVPLEFEPRVSASGVLAQARPEPGEVFAAREHRLDCLECCLQKLTPEQRELIVEYYRDGRGQRIEQRRDMAKRLGITMNALGIRACRIRSTLEACVAACKKER